MSFSLYQPSNGTEGYSFIEKWCGNCERDKCQNGSIPMDQCNDDDFCQILGRTMMHNISDPDYPKEWIKDESGPRCTAFVNIGDSVPIRDPNTVDMFGQNSFCQMCNGHGMIGGLLSGEGGYHGEPCPDCSEPNKKDAKA